MFDDLLGMICLDCAVTAALCYALWAMVPQTATSNEVRALVVFIVGMASKPVLNAVTGIFSK
jgi:hypothetical protein